MANAIPPREHSRIVVLMTNPRVQVVFAAIVLCAIALFGYAMFAFRPYDGMRLFVGDTANYIPVSIVFDRGPADDAGILEGDQILAIDGQPVDGWGNTPPYRPYIRPGDTVVYELERDGRRLTVPATMGSYQENLPLLLTFVGLLLLSILFWVIGLAICMFAASNDVRARLVGFVWLLGAVTMVTGGPGTLSKFWGAYTILYVAFCLLGPALVSMHLYFPAPSFVKHQRLVIGILTVVALVLSILVIWNQCFLNPQGLELPTALGFSVYGYMYIFFLLSVLASAGLLLRNRLISKDAETRRQTGIVFWGTALGFLPFLALEMIPLLVFNTSYGSYATVLFLVFMPLAYAYAIHQQKLLHLDFFINRIVVFFALLLIVLAASVLIMGVVAFIFNLPSDFILVGGVVASLIAIPSANLRQPVQKRVNKVLYGCHYDFPTVTSAFSSQLAQTLDRETLVDLLGHKLAQQMGIHRVTLFLSEGNSLNQCFPQHEDLDQSSISVNDELCQLLLERQAPVQASQVQQLLSDGALTFWQSYDWAQLLVPLTFENELVGLLILGNRTVGDLYGSDDIHLIATIAQQGALAYKGVQLVQMLRGLNYRLVRKDETHRKHMARELHDTALQKLFFIKEWVMTQDNNKVILLLDETIDALRGMIRDQRPPLIEQGLIFALQGMAENVQELTNGSPAISFSTDLSDTNELRLPEEQATALFRITQEAVTNAIKHANAQEITISVMHSSNDGLRLLIEDDGTGMRLIPADRIGEHHYGLIGMQERAAMIDAELEIVSSPGEGTHIEVRICR
jgi:two-component system sensor histidine kinase ComP